MKSNIRKPMRREGEQTATSLAMHVKKGKGGRIVTNVQVLPQFEMVEKKYGHTVKVLGLKRVELTPSYEIAPIAPEVVPLLRERSVRPKRKKNALEQLRQSLKIYVEKMSRK